MKKTRVLIVDDYPLVRRGLVALIAQEADLEVCGEASNGSEALQKVKDLQPDVAVIDISLGGMSGIDLIRQIRVHNNRVKAIVFSMYDEVLFAERAFRAGALGYIEKKETADKVIDAIRRVARAQVVLPERMARRIAQQRPEGAKKSTPSPLEKLSDRELEVFELIGRGLTSREITDKLHLSVKTIETHRQHIKTKLALQTNSELVWGALQWVLDLY